MICIFSRPDYAKFLIFRTFASISRHAAQYAYMTYMCIKIFVEGHYDFLTAHQYSMLGIIRSKSRPSTEIQGQVRVL
jgi:hypothetical protein